METKFGEFETKFGELWTKFRELVPMAGGRIFRKRAHWRAKTWLLTRHKFRRTFPVHSNEPNPNALRRVLM